MGTFREHLRVTLCTLMLNTTFRQTSFLRGMVEEHLQLSTDRIKQVEISETENTEISSLTFDFGDMQIEYLCTFTKVETEKEPTKEVVIKEVEVKPKRWNFLKPKHPTKEIEVEVEENKEETPKETYWLLTKIE